jgi:transcriptional regulator with XRE-family HTH domain
MTPTASRGNTQYRRQQVLALRERGLTMRKIAQKLGVCINTVYYSLRHPEAVAVSCRVCQTLIFSGTHGLSGQDSVLCLGCLAALPEVTFGQRLRSGRLTLGLSLRQLAAESGVTSASLSLYERDMAEPTWSILFQLMRVIGFGFVTAGLKQACMPTHLQGRSTCRRTTKSGENRNVDDRHSDKRLQIAQAGWQGQE